MMSTCVDGFINASDQLRKLFADMSELSVRTDPFLYGIHPFGNNIFRLLGMPKSCGASRDISTANHYISLEITKNFPFLQ